MSPEFPSVKRRLVDPAPRDQLVEERVNLKLTFKAKVCRESYVFTGSFVERLHISDDSIRSIYRLVETYIEKYSKKPRNYELQKLVDEVNSKLKELVKMEPSREPPKYDTKVIIPASAVKGAIRSRVEYKLSPEVSCYRIEGEELPQRHFYERHLQFWGNDVVNPRGSCNFIRDGKVCVVCDLFGAPGLASRIYFSDLEMVNGGVTDLRDLNIEAIAPNSEFTLTTSIVNCGLVDLGLLFLGLELYSQSPVLLCAYKYRHNPHAGGSRYGGRFMFGAVRFQLDTFNEILTNRLADLVRRRLDRLKEAGRVSNEELIEAARLELVDRLGNNVFFDRGVIEIEC